VNYFSWLKMNFKGNAVLFYPNSLAMCPWRMNTRQRENNSPRVWLFSRDEERLKFSEGNQFYSKSVLSVYFTAATKWFVKRWWRSYRLIRLNANELPWLAKTRRNFNASGSKCSYTCPSSRWKKNLKKWLFATDIYHSVW